MTSVAPIFARRQTDAHEDGNHALTQGRPAAGGLPVAVAPRPALAVKLEPAQLRPLAFRVFTKKYNLTLRSDALVVLATHIGTRCGQAWRTTAEPILDEIARSWKRLRSAEPIVDEANLLPIIKSLDIPHPARPASLVTREDSIAAAAATTAAGTGDSADASITGASLAVDPRQHLRCIDAFTQPAIRFDHVRGVFEHRPKLLKTSLAGPEARTDNLRERYHYLLARVKRHESFQRPAVLSTHLPSSTTTPRSTQETGSYHRITCIKNLLGRQGGRFMLFGLLARAPDGGLVLEDPDDCVKLDLSKAQLGGGWFVPGCFVLVDGVYTREEVLRVDAIGLPPAEPRSESRDCYAGCDFLGTAIERSHERHLRRTELTLTHSKIVICNTCHLDDPRHLAALRKCLTHYDALPDIQQPLAIVLVGDFCTTGFAGLAADTAAGIEVAGSPAYKRLWDDFAALVEASCPKLIKRTRFICVPGPNDPWTVPGSPDLHPLPRRPIPQAFTTRLARILGPSNFTRASNPCRITYFTQELVILRDDVTARLQRLNISGLCAGPAAPIDLGPGVAPIWPALNDTARTLISQASLSPFADAGGRTHDHAFAADALRLMPLPTTLILCQGGVMGDVSGKLLQTTGVALHARTQTCFPQTLLPTATQQGKEARWTQLTLHDNSIDYMSEYI
ncbi:DNA-directed DNA polymerase epsilon, subunit B [Savitreella phatthalungensis]